MIPEGWWYSISHLRVELIPTVAVPGIPVSNGAAYWDDGNIKKYSMHLSKISDAPRGICFAFLKVLLNRPDPKGWREPSILLNERAYRGVTFKAVDLFEDATQLTVDEYLEIPPPNTTFPVSAQSIYELALELKKLELAGIEQRAEYDDVCQAAWAAQDLLEENDDGA